MGMVDFEQLVTTALAVGLWLPNGVGRWVRHFEEEGTRVEASFGGNVLSLGVWPSIPGMEHHEGKRIAFGAAAEISVRIAEKAGARITHNSRLGPCAVPSQTVEVAHYPLAPFTYEALCVGFRELLLGAS